MANFIDVIIGGKDLLSGHLRSWGPQWVASAKATSDQLLAVFNKPLKPQMGKPNIPEGYYKDPQGRWRGPDNRYAKDPTKSEDGSKGGLGDIFLGNLLANAVSSLMETLWQGLQSVAQRFTASLMDAARLETTTIARAGDIAMNMGLTMRDAQNLHELTQTEIAKIAAALPGETRDFTAVLDGIAPAVSSVFRDNTEGYRDAILDISKRTGVLASVNHADPTMAGNALNRAISGTTGLGELFVIDIFQKSAQFQGAIRNSLAQMGKSTEDWKKLTSEQRLQIIQGALRIATPDEMLREFEGTTESIIQSIKTNLFDPVVGTFGFLRDVSGVGDRNVLDAVAAFLQNWMRLMGSLGGILADNGLSFDPMGGLIRFIDWLNDLVVDLNSWLDGQGSINLGNIGGTLSGLFGSIDGTGLAMRLMDGLGWAINSILQGFVDWGLSINWMEVGSGLFKAVWFAFGALGYLLYTQVDWGSLVAALVVTLGGAIHVFIGAFGSGLLNTIGLYRGLLKTIGDTTISIVGSILDALKALWDKVSSFVGRALGWVEPSAPVQAVSRVDGSNPITGLAGSIIGKPEDTQTAPIGTLSSPQVSNQQALTFAPQVSVQATTNADPEAIATATVSRLGGMFEAARAARLTN